MSLNAATNVIEFSLLNASAVNIEELKQMIQKQSNFIITNFRQLLSTFNERLSKGTFNYVTNIY